MSDVDEADVGQRAQNSVILMVSQSGNICSITEASETIREQLAGDSEPSSIAQLWDDEILECVRNSVRKALRSRESCSIDIEHSNDTTQEFLFIPQGPDRVLIVVRDLTEQKRQHERAHELAYTDTVTGLPNREFLYAELQRIIDIQRLKEGRSAVICVHLSQFDDYGYSLGSGQQDEVIAQLADRLTSHLRGSNNKETSDYERYSVIARTDYRQFCIVLPSIESGEDAEAVAERLIADLKQPINVTNRTINVYACAGIALYPQDGTDAKALFENALAAMEDARTETQTSIKFHSGTVRLRALQRTDLEAELKSALENDDYALNYLPIVDAQTRAPVAMEALLRWPDAVLGSQPTRKIVRVAERTGLIASIGEWVMRSACKQMAIWHSAGYENLRIAVNVSAQELADESIVGRVERILRDTGADPAFLDLELKEHILFREMQSGFAICRQLKALGLRLVVDDYGTGTCSLAHLSQSPIDALKIDNSFTANLEQDERDRAACAAALAMAAELGFDVIAEGVETESQAEILAGLGCRYLQGFLLSMPMRSDETFDYLTTSMLQGSSAEEAS